MPDRIDRREFLTRSALGAVALTLPRIEPMPRALGLAPAGMFVSLPPWAVARNVGWPEQARLAARVGYRGVAWPFESARSVGVDATRALLAELAIEPTVTNLPMQDPLGSDDAAFEKQLPMLAEKAAFCQAIGCRRFQYPMSATTLDGQSKADRWNHVQRRLAAVDAVVGKYDMRLGIEFLGPLMFRMRRSRPGAPPPDPATPPPVPFVWTLNDALALSEASGANIGVTLDAWHWYHSGGTVADIRAAKASRIVDVHVSDARPMAPEDVRDDMRWLPGEGVIDLIGFFQALKAIGYQGSVLPEVIGPRIPKEMVPEESARIALDATIAVMRKAGAV
ncbi:MAG: sugar phosphate isomerase/epimerase [bacterium]